MRTLFDESIAKSRARNVVFERGVRIQYERVDERGVDGREPDGEGWVVKWDSRRGKS